MIAAAGPEAVTWLQGQLSQDVAGLAVGAAAATFVLAPQGKVEGWGRVTRVADDALQIDVDPGAGAAWIARLERFKLRTKADLTLREEVPTVAVRGASAEVEAVAVPSSLTPLAAAGPGQGQGQGGFDVIESDAGPAGLDEVVQAVRAAGGTEGSELDLESLRIRAGVPRWGAELDDDTIPATVGQWVIDASVSFTKGCYTGQELVARIDSRGGNVPRRLALLLVEAALLERGDAVSTADGTGIGPITSAAPDLETPDGSVALVFAPRAVELPASVVAAGQAGRLVDLATA